jgi:hypothetical protein
MAKKDACADGTGLTLSALGKFCRIMLNMSGAGTLTRKSALKRMRHLGNTVSNAVSRGERTMLGSSCVCYGKWEAGALFGPSPTTEDGPRRTRRLRHCLSTEHGTPVFQQGTHPLGTREILPPDILRQRRSQAVVRRRRGGSIFYPKLLPLELSALVNGAAELSGCSLAGEIHSNENCFQCQHRFSCFSHFS